MQAAVTIKDISWVFQVLSDSQYEDKHGKESHAMTDKDIQVVDFKASSFSKKLVNHELLHVYSASCCIGSLHELSTSDMEEICAEIIEFHLDDIAKLSKKLYNSLKEYNKKNDTTRT